MWPRLSNPNRRKPHLYRILCQTDILLNYATTIIIVSSIRFQLLQMRASQRRLATSVPLTVTSKRSVCGWRYNTMTTRPQTPSTTLRPRENHLSRAEQSNLSPKLQALNGSPHSSSKRCHHVIDRSRMKLSASAQFFVGAQIGRGAVTDRLYLAFLS